MDVVRLETERLILDLPVERDIPFIYAYCQDPLIQEFTTVPQPYSLDDAEGFLRKVVNPGWSSGAELTWAIRRKSEPTLVGVVSLRDWNAEQVMLGFWLGAPWRGHGYMPEAARVVTDWAFTGEWDRGSRAPQTTVLWEALVGNASSALVAQRIGFRYQGVGPSSIQRAGISEPSHHAALTAEDRPGPADGWPTEVFAR